MKYEHLSENLGISGNTNAAFALADGEFVVMVDHDDVLELDALEQKALKLLHAKTGAAIARDVFGVDEELYNAIWWHTTGHADMTLLEKIIYLADYIEPTRAFPGVDELRKACYEDLNKGLLMGLEMSIEEMQGMGNPVHHATIEARDALKG